MSDVYQQFANVFGSITPVLVPFIGVALAGVLVGYLMSNLKK
jgi:hypothetical protein